MIYPTFDHYMVLSLGLMAFAGEAQVRGEGLQSNMYISSRRRELNMRREERLDLLLVALAELQERVWEGLERLEAEGRLLPEIEEHAREVMRDVSYWLDQCTAAEEAPPILQRRMEVHLERIRRLAELLEAEIGASWRCDR